MCVFYFKTRTFPLSLGGANPAQSYLKELHILMVDASKQESKASSGLDLILLLFLRATTTYFALRLRFS